jgi:hypothetical protein
MLLVLARQYECDTSDNVLMVTLRRVTTLCVLPVGVAMGARGSEIHDIYFPGARGLGIH